MRPIRPHLSTDSDARFINLGAGQPQYLELPAYRSPQGVVQTEWELDDADRSLIAAGGRIQLFTHTFRQPFQPVILRVTEGTGFAYCTYHDFAFCPQHAGECIGGERCHVLATTAPQCQFCSVCCGALVPKVRRGNER